MDQPIENKRHARKRILWGLVLVAMGFLFLFEHLEAIDLAMMWQFWPMILVISGLVDVLSATRWKHIADGLNQIVIGLWFFCCLEHIWGFTWTNSWPVLLIGIGLSVVLGAFPDRANKQ